MTNPCKFAASQSSITSSVNNRRESYAADRDLVSFHAVFLSSARYTLGYLVPAICITARICAHRLLQQLLFLRCPRRWIASDVIHLSLGSTCSIPTWFICSLQSFYPPSPMLSVVVIDMVLSVRLSHCVIMSTKDDLRSCGFTKR